MKSYFFTFILAGLFLIFTALPLVEGADIGTYTRGSDVETIQTCNNCTYCNLTSVRRVSPTRLTLLNNVTMVEDRTEYKYVVAGANHTVLGDYKYCYDCGNLVERNTGCIDYYITTTGRGKINAGEGLSIFMSLFVMLIIGILLFYVGTRFESNAMKVILIGCSVIVFFIAILYTVMIMTQNFGGFSAFTEGYSTFFFVIRVLGGVLLLFFVLWGLFIAIKSWKIHRGLLDAD